MVFIRLGGEKVEGFYFHNNWKVQVDYGMNMTEIPFSDYNGDLTARQCGSVGGEMVKRMVEEYESHLK